MNELTVIVPTRSRPQNVKPILDAWWQTGAFGIADLVFVLDQDDMSLDEYTRILTHEIPTHFVIRPEWRPLVPKLNDAAVEVSERSRFVAFMGDDHIPRTPNWASEIVAAHVKETAGLVYGRDGFQDRNKPTWWSVDSRWIQQLGRMVPSDVQHLYCDDVMLALGEKAGSVFYAESVLIEHMHPVVGKGEMDAQYERVNRAQQYERDGAAFRAYLVDGLDRDASLLSSIWG